MSALSGPASAILGLAPMMWFFCLVGLVVSLYLRQGGQRSGPLVLIMLMLVALVVFPNLAGMIKGIESGDDLLDQPREEVFNFTVITKGIEYEKGFLGPKKIYVLILSDGEKYPVPRDVYEMLDTGDSVMITISANRRKITFTEGS